MERRKIGQYLHVSMNECGRYSKVLRYKNPDTPILSVFAMDVNSSLLAKHNIICFYVNEKIDD